MPLPAQPEEKILGARLQYPTGGEVRALFGSILGMRLLSARSQLFAPAAELTFGDFLTRLSVAFRTLGTVQCQFLTVEGSSGTVEFHLEALSGIEANLLSEEASLLIRTSAPKKT